jgi:hypothetical protein
MVQRIAIPPTDDAIIIMTSRVLLFVAAAPVGVGTEVGASCSWVLTTVEVTLLCEEVEMGAAAGGGVVGASVVDVELLEVVEVDDTDKLFELEDGREDVLDELLEGKRLERRPLTRPGVPEAPVEVAELEGNGVAAASDAATTLAAGVGVVTGGFSAGSCPAPMTGTGGANAVPSRFLTILFILTWSLREGWNSLLA